MRADRHDGTRLTRQTLVMALGLIACLFAAELSAFSAIAQAVRATQPIYETRTDHDPNGTGKFYMGREIAQVMGAGGITWLNRPQREDEEKPALVIAALNLKGGETVADIGAGSGFYTFKIAPKVGPSGKVLAVDIQDEMVAALRRGAADRNAMNVEVTKGSERDPHLPANSVDLVLMVDVYHELSFPYEMMTAIRNALKPGGRMVFVEYRKEDPAVAIKEVHKMAVDQLKKEMGAVRLTYIRTVETLPLQHIVIFEKRD
ncbi:MAG TPA: class I SAM-dependent methyltransferase [Candidatus Angelobacter sp.]|nr:class I SAM-dependent methyltransferase [Candidatus Angelobacter sp.]